MEITFVNPAFLWFLFSIPFLFLLHMVTIDFTKRKAVKFANFEALQRVDRGIHTGKIFSRNLSLLALQIMTLLLLVFAISGMTLWYQGMSSDYDFVIAIDASGSMLANDLHPSRIEAAKEAAINFVDTIKKNTMVGVISFSGTGFIKQKMTDNKIDIINAVSSIQIEFASGTAIGDAIITGVNLFQDTTDKGKVIVLITDGQSNVGVLLDQAIAYANKNHVTVNTIGIGTEQGGALTGISALSKLDEEEMKRIAENTGGRYFRAESAEGLDLAYSQIATETEKKVPLRLTIPLLILALIMISIEWVLINTKYRTIP